MTLCLLAFESGIRVNQIGRIERCEINTSLTSLSLLAKALDVEPCELIRVCYKTDIFLNYYSVFPYQTPVQKADKISFANYLN